MLRYACVPVTLAFLLGSSPSAHAATMLSCPDSTSTTDRVFTLTTDVPATCYSYGTGNINGNNDAINQQGWTTLDKSDDHTSGSLDGYLTIVGQGTTSGSFAINPIAWTSFKSIALGFKSGEGQLDPDWAVFVLSSGTVSGTWSISGNQSLSHANLYGGDASVLPPPVATPEPAGRRRR